MCASISMCPSKYFHGQIPRCARNDRAFTLRPFTFTLYTLHFTLYPLPFLSDGLHLLDHLAALGKTARVRSIVAQLEHGGELAVHAAEVAHGLGPVDSAFERHQVLILRAVVVMDVRRADMLLERLKRRSHAPAHMSVSRIKADVQLQPRILNELKQAFRRAELVRNVLEQDLRAAVLGEDVQVLERGEGGVELAHVVLLAGQPEVDDEVAKRKLLGDFDGAL